MEHAVAVHDVRMRDIECRLSGVELTSYDGTLLWKISEFSRRRREAVSSASSAAAANSTSLLSPAFYTSRTGQPAFFHHTPSPALSITPHSLAVRGHAPQTPGR